VLPPAERLLGKRVDVLVDVGLAPAGADEVLGFDGFQQRVCLLLGGQ